MQPTIDADLRASRLTLERLVTDDEVSPETAAVLDQVMRTMRRAERTWATVLPYLVAENHATARLLTVLGPLLPSPFTDEIAALGDGAAGSGESAGDLDAATVNAHNERLRGVLARVIAALPDGPAGDDARAKVGAHLEEVLQRRPW